MSVSNAKPKMESIGSESGISDRVSLASDMHCSFASGMELSMPGVRGRMVSGYPLQYCNPLYKPFIPQGFPEYEYSGYYGVMEISEEVMMPASPTSVQSDSDASLSSTDVPRIPSSPISSKPKSSSEIKCGWRQCGLWFESLDQLATHVSKAHASSGPSGLFYCGWEGCTRNMKGFNARYKMLVHVRTHTNEKPHRCFQCDKSFSRAENLKIHSRSHSGEKPYVCPIPGCGKAYSNSSDRFKHTRTHQVDKPYECKIPGCIKRYTDPSSLRKHVKTYKHEGVVNKVEEKEEKMKNFDEKVMNFEEKNNMDCKCSHGCCLKSCLTKAAEIFKLGALFGNTGIDSWDKFLIQQNDYRNNQVMECDGPLDLTVHRK